MAIVPIGPNVESQPLNDNFNDLDTRQTSHEDEKAQDDVHGLLSGGKIIEESGSNANGYYVRFADGTQICWHNAQIDLNVTTLQSYSYPAAFSAAPASSVSFGVTSNTTIIQGMKDVVIQSHPSEWRLYVAGTTSANTPGVFLLAIGRWK